MKRCSRQLSSQMAAKTLIKNGLMSVILNGLWNCFGDKIIIVLANREENLLRHVAMVAKFLDDT